MSIKEHLKYKEIYEAMLAGKTLQFNCNCSSSVPQWTDYTTQDLYLPNCRIKPTPTLRPWRPEEVPVGAWIKVKELKYLDGLHIQMLLYMCPLGVTLSARNSTMECSLQELLSVYEHSLDHGKTWLPCGVIE